MAKRFKTLGIVLVAMGLVFLAIGGVAYTRVADGYDALKSFSDAQNVTLSYNEDGQLIDRGTTEGAEAIMTLLKDEWGYPVVQSDLDSDDPVVNTASEYMFQMATIGYHVLHGTQTVVLAEDAEYKGEVFAAGTHEVPVDGRYWTDFDRSHPLEGPARSQAWSGTVHGLFAELGVGTITHTSLQVGWTLIGIFAGLGFLSIVSGAGLIWAVRGKEDEKEAMPEIVIPDTIPEDIPKEVLVK